MDNTIKKLIDLYLKARPYTWVTLLLLIAVFIFVGSAVRFFASQGIGCTVCHETRAEASSLQQSPHRAVSCYACHQDDSSLAFATDQLKVARNFTEWLFRSYSKPIVSEVKNSGCLNCHDRDIEATTISNGVRVSHKEFAAYRCTDCHGTIAHDMKSRARSYPDMDSCSACHNYNAGDISCEKCHPSDAPDEKLARRGPWSITHGPNWKTAHGMGNPSTCSTCHDAKFCTKCHDAEVPHPQPWSQLHPKSAKQNVEACYTCHEKSYCLDCHRLPMPHPVDFLRKHKYTALQRGMSLCNRCHVASNCMPCHYGAAHPNVPSNKFLKEGQKSFFDIGTFGD